MCVFYYNRHFKTAILVTVISRVKWLCNDAKTEESFCNLVFFHSFCLIAWETKPYDKCSGCRHYGHALSFFTQTSSKRLPPKSCRTPKARSFTTTERLFWCSPHAPPERDPSHSPFVIEASLCSMSRIGTRFLMLKFLKEEVILYEGNTLSHGPIRTYIYWELTACSCEKLISG